ncbi:MAG: hypothetical protein EXR95_08365 [Gemmatimonadetes bacterium]|nr:hypothetical protein [Gemmatimonadota bacterium]
MTPSPFRAPRAGRLRRSFRAVCLVAAVTALSCADDGTSPDDLRFGQIGEVRIEVDAPLARGIGGLRQVITWSSDGPWRRTEGISYRGRPGDETVALSRDDPGILARSYASWIALVNDETPLKLFLGDLLNPDLNPSCLENQSRVSVFILDTQRNDSISWTRCADGLLGSLSAAAAGPDPTAGRVIQAAQLVRDFTVGATFVSAYNGSIPFGTLDRGEQSKAPLSVPRVIEDTQTWASFWAQHRGSSAAPPAVDFVNELVVVAAVGVRPEAGDSVEVRGVLEVGFGTQINLWERRPGNFCTPAPRSHAPFHIVIAPQVKHPIFFSVVDVDKVPCG